MAQCHSGRQGLRKPPPSKSIRSKTASDHGTLVEHEETLQVLQRLIEDSQLPKPATIKAADRTLGFEKASRAEADQLVT